MRSTLRRKAPHWIWPRFSKMASEGAVCWPCAWGQEDLLCSRPWHTNGIKISIILLLMGSVLLGGEHWGHPASNTGYNSVGIVCYWWDWIVLLKGTELFSNRLFHSLIFLTKHWEIAASVLSMYKSLLPILMFYHIDYLPSSVVNHEACKYCRKRTNL